MLNHTPFYEMHDHTSAKFIDFGGWEMPLQYAGIKQEHKAVRDSVGLFDVSHMGELFVTGPEALALIQYVTINDAEKLTPGQAQYSAMCYPNGGIIDDLLVYMLSDATYMLVVNASNIEKDFDWINKHNCFNASVNNKSDDMCLLAVQGPRSGETLQKLTNVELAKIAFYTFVKTEFVGYANILLSATGYTGEKGFEIYFDKNEADPESIWHAIMDAGEPFNIQPCGLGARDTLRLEMGFALYGNDITKETNPLEAGMSWLTKLDKDDFIGRQALLRVKKEGVDRKLVGLKLKDRRAIPRAGYSILDENKHKIGSVTSGTRSITLGNNIGMGYVAVDKASMGTKVYIRIRNKVAQAEVMNPPFLEK